MHPATRPLLCLVLCVGTQWATAEELGASLAGLLAYAREHNPDLAMRAREAEASHAAVEAASALPDPNFQIDLMDINNSMTGGKTSILPGQVGETRYQVTQPLPFYGKRALRGEVARHQAAQGDAQRDTTWLEVESSIRSAFARYYQAAEQERILDESRGLLADMERLAVSRYGVGLVPQQDVLRTQGEITLLKVEALDARQRRRIAAATLNALLPRPADAPLAVPSRLEPLVAVASLARLRQQIDAQAPELARDQAAIAAARSALALTQRERYPDFELGLRDNRPRGAGAMETWDVMVSVNIPLQQGARRSREAEAVRRLEATQAALEATRSRIEGRLGEVHAGLVSNRDKAELLRGSLLPQAEATARAARVGYETGQADFNTLIEARRQILRTRLMLLDAEVEVALRQAEIERITGSKP